jgi:chromosome segregation ATPase
MEEMNQVEGTSTEIKDPIAVLAALERAKADAKRFREEKEALETQVEDYKNRTSQVNNQLLNEKISKHLSERGIQNADRLLKYIKLDEIKMSDDYEIVGLDSQIDDLKEDLPELFDPKVIVGGKADSGTQGAVNVPLSASEIQARLILGR